MGCKSHGDVWIPHEFTTQPWSGFQWISDIPLILVGWKNAGKIASKSDT